MTLACLGAVIAFFKGTGYVAAAPDSSTWVELWRMFGLLAFAGMFALLAIRPRLSAGVWALAPPPSRQFENRGFRIFEEER